MDDGGLRLLCGTPELPPNCVALTFDDGPGPQSAELALMLRDEGVPAAFFVLGESIERYAHVLETYRECGHLVGLHADWHRPFRSVDHAAAELRRCAQRVGEHLDDVVWFRPPYGRGNWPVPGFAGPVGWHTQGRDWDITYRRGQTVEGCVDTITRSLIRRGGGIVLLHDFAPASEFRPAGLTEADLDLRIIEITKSLIERVRAAGLSFVGLPEPGPVHRSDPAPVRPSETAPTASDAAAGAPAPEQPVPVVREAGMPEQSAGPLGAAEDLQNLRLFRSTAKAAGGVLDLMMPMRVGGDGPILFCAPPMVGLSWCYLALLPHLDARFPLYGLQCRGLRRPEPLPATMPEMARDFADQMQMIQPHGPYHMLGWSLGGNIAFAIAEEFERRGEPTGLLAILDSTMVDLEAIEDNEAWMIYNLVLAQFGYVPALTPADPNPEAKMLDLVRRRPGLGLDEWGEQRIRALQRVINNNVALARAYQPGRVHCPLLFFSATRNEPTLPEKLEAWGRFVDGPTDYVELDCHHRYMLLPEPISKIGPALAERLARAATALPAPIV